MKPSSPKKSRSKEVVVTEEGTIEVRLTGTTPLSFVRPGKVLTVKSYEPTEPKTTRPVVGAKFTKRAYIVFNGVTKVGRLSDKAIEKLLTVPEKCTVVKSDAVKKQLVVSFAVK